MFRALMSETSVGIVALIVLILLVWFGGHYLGMPENTRALIAGLVTVVWFAVFIAQRILVVRRAVAIEDRLRSQAQEQMAGVRPDRKPQIQALEKQLGEAIQTLKTSRLGKGALYALPWYIIIGPPGSGKSTALQESGLNFPYTNQGRRGIRGVGGTRNCDWWFTDQGILLDTAGRYTTELEDRDEWLAFLDMLKKCRKRKPINGAMVCIAIPDLLQATEAELESHVRNIRERIDELTRRLELIFPVYLVFTKCDLLNGFVEFFEDFGKSERAQIWGVTFSAAPGQSRPNAETVAEELKNLYRRLTVQRAAALATERPPDKKRLIYSFPGQLALARNRIVDFVADLFKSDPFQESSPLRGVYFTSGTQEGTPIDQLVAAMGQAFGIQSEAGSMVSQTVDKKSYFLNNLFTKVIFPDQNLARSTTRVERQRRVLRIGTVAGSAALLAVLSVSMAVSCAGNLRLIHSTGGDAAEVRRLEREQASDVEANLAAMENLREELERLHRYKTQSLPLSLRWGLYRGSSINAQARKVYFDRLKMLFLEPCGRLLAEELQRIRQNREKKFKDFEVLYDLMRVYLKLGDEAAQVKPDLVHAMLKDRWTAVLGASASDRAKELAQAQLTFFIDQISMNDVPRIATDSRLIDEVASDLGGGLWATEAYRDILAGAGTRFPLIGPDTFIKGRGRGLFWCEEEYLIPGVFTQSAYDEYVKVAMKEKSEDLAQKLATVGRPKDADAIAKDLQQIYADAYVKRWESFLANVKLKPFDHLADAAQKLRAITAVDSPYKDLFKGIWDGRRLQLSATEVLNQTGDDRKWVDDALKAIEELRRELDAITATTEAGNRVVSMKPESLQGLQRAFIRATRDIDDASKSADPSLAAAAQAALRAAPDNALRALRAEAQKEADQSWKSTVHAVFMKDFDGRFPFAEGAENGVSLRTFSQMFNPKTGTFWKTYDIVRRLRETVIDNRPLIEFSRDFETAVQKASAIRDGMYRDSEQLSVHFWITLKERPGVNDIVFTVGNETFKLYDRPEPHRGELNWIEGQSKGGKISISVGKDHWIHHDCSSQEWGLWRLLRRGKITPTGAKTLTCLWEFKAVVLGVENTYAVDVDFEAEQERHPFQPGFFTEFKCPSKVGS
ncbi:MAG: type VI secretion system membrane subunit TssM [Planctomycetes bacterium]|nr:type VI secretion system membrane subunit TssM [Planctomycetota bacterium]